jgi:uncharacterized protein (TIGR00730 family)
VLAAWGLGLVYGGANVGTMRDVANSALAGGGEVIGVIPAALVEKELAHSGLTELRVVATMHERKAVMAELADGFISLPGGYGTLDELFEVVTWAQLGLHEKPCGLLNVKGFFDAVIAHLEHAVDRGFLKVEHRALVLVDEDPESLLATFRTYRPPRTGKWIRQEEI